MKKIVYVLAMMTLLIGVAACQKREEALASPESKEVEHGRMKALLVRLSGKSPATRPGFCV